MIKVYWDEDGNEVNSKNPDGIINKNFDNNNWYSYINTSITENTHKSKWANAKTSDGSYWVWIPRYEYKINYKNELNKSLGGTIDVNFISIDKRVPSEDYKIHPSFEDGSNTNFMNGEWDSELSGFWVAKYEMSMETSKESIITEKETIGNVLTSDNIKAVSKPGVTSWRYITIGNSYTNAYNYDREKESHLMKNSEWGAVAYLTHSKYGRNEEEITINSNSSYYTGGGQNVTATTNKTQSSTGNATGIYDLNGGAWERVAGYITNGNGKLATYGKEFVERIEKDSGAYKTLSTKYSTIYPFNDLSESYENNWSTYSELESNVYGYGDAILETSSSGKGVTSWNSDSSYFVYSVNTFFYRGGNYQNGDNAGIFTFSSAGGEASKNDSFRAVLSI